MNTVEIAPANKAANFYATHPVIQLDNVHKMYSAHDVSVSALRGISLRIEHGEFVAITGASGSGKSTLINTLGCLDRPTSGRYLLDGTDITTLDRDELADIRNRRIGFVFQGFNLLARTTSLENVELPMLCGNRRVAASRVRARALECLTQVGLSNRIGHFPNQLSGGQQQRVAIARALVNEPGIIFADEPTGNLDSKTSAEIMDLFRVLNDSGVTIVIVTHEIDVANSCKRNLTMRDGELANDHSTLSAARTNVA